jgi:hypothetical protein
MEAARALLFEIPMTFLLSYPSAVAHRATAMESSSQTQPTMFRNTLPRYNPKNENVPMTGRDIFDGFL